MTSPTLQAKTGVSLPELPEAHGVFMIHDFNAKPGDPIRYRDVFTAEQMRAYATASLAAERAEAVRLSAALRDAIFELEFSGMAYDHPKLVSLRAALSPTQQGN